MDALPSEVVRLCMGYPRIVVLFLLLVNSLWLIGSVVP